LRDRAFPQHHFAETILAVAASGEDELATVEEQIALNASQGELKVAGKASGIDFIQQGEKFMMTLDFAGIEREVTALEPTGRKRNGFEAGVFSELLDEAMQTGAIITAHVDELETHSVTGAPVTDDCAGAHFAAGNVEEHFHMSASRKRMSDE
jgi:hypothetical protein